MKLENKDWSFRVFGDINYRGSCPKEEIEQIDFFSWLAFNYPDYAALAIHPKNEGKRTYQQVTRETMLGSINTGASDVIIPAGFSFVCEIKRRDHTKSKWQKGQPEFLTRATKKGSFSCVALGCSGAKLAFKEYLSECELISQFREDLDFDVRAGINIVTIKEVLSRLPKVTK